MSTDRGMDKEDVVYIKTYIYIVCVYVYIYIYSVSVYMYVYNEILLSHKKE